MAATIEESIGRIGFLITDLVRDLPTPEYKDLLFMRMYMHVTSFHSPDDAFNEKALQLSVEEIEQLAMRFQVEVAHNKEQRNLTVKNRDTIKDLCRRIFVGLGIPTTQTSGKAGKEAKTKQFMSFCDAAIAELGEKTNARMQGIEGYRFDRANVGGRIFRSSKSTVLERWLDLKRQYEHTLTLKNEEDRRLEQYTIMAVHLGVFNLDKKKMIDAVEDIKRAEWVAENYPDGTELTHDACSECSTWFVGEYRCSCGNRRMYLQVEGNAVNGYYAYGMAD